MLPLFLHLRKWLELRAFSDRDKEVQTRQSQSTSNPDGRSKTLKTYYCLIVIRFRYSQKQF